MTFTIRPAVREKIGLLFGLAGPSGSGKTFTALLLAKSLAGPNGKIAVIDTESGRALLYAPPPGKSADGVRTFDFLHVDFQPPFSPERYVEAVKACEGAGVNAIVIDSMSHEWAGEGGCSDIQAIEAVRMATNRKTGEVDEWRMDAVTAPAWKKPKMQHQRMMARLVQTRTHLIFCLRAQEKIKIVKKADGKGTEIVPIGFQPICEKAFMFELSGSFMLHPDRPGAPDYTLAKKLNSDLQGIFPDGEIVGPNVGERLRAWAETGADRPPPDRAAQGVRDIVERIQDTPPKDLAEYLAGEKVKTNREWLANNRPELAALVDDAVRIAEALLERDGASLRDVSDPIAALIAKIEAAEDKAALDAVLVAEQVAITEIDAEQRKQVETAVAAQRLGFTRNAT